MQAGQPEEQKEDPKAKGKKAAEPKKPAGKAKAEVIPDGTVLNVSQYQVSPALGTVAPGSAALITVVFNAQGNKFYESNLCIDIAGRNTVQEPI